MSLEPSSLSFPLFPQNALSTPKPNRHHLHSCLSKVKVIECALKIEGKSAKGVKSSIHCSNEDFALYYVGLSEAVPQMCV